MPLDVDLEDRLLYGLTPTRLAYMVVAILAGFSLWSSSWAPVPVRGLASLACIGMGAALSWGNWRGRAADAWIVDLFLFVARTRRLAWNLSGLRFPPRKAEVQPEGAEPEASASPP